MIEPRDIYLELLNDGSIGSDPAPDFARWTLADELIEEGLYEDQSTHSTRFYDQFFVCA